MYVTVLLLESECFTALVEQVEKIVLPNQNKAKPYFKYKRQNWKNTCKRKVVNFLETN